MSPEFEKITPRALWLGLAKVVIMLTVLLLVAALVISTFFSVGDSQVTGVTINALLFAVAVSILASGALSILRIIDWFGARRASKGDQNG